MIAYLDIKFIFRMCRIQFLCQQILIHLCANFFQLARQFFFQMSAILFLKCALIICKNSVQAEFSLKHRAMLCNSDYSIAQHLLYHSVTTKNS